MRTDQPPECVKRGTSVDANEAYLAIDAVNWSSLRNMDVSPKFYRYRLKNPAPTTDAKQRGIAIHCAVFEPERWVTDYLAQPDFGNLRYKANKEKRAEWTETAPADAIVLRHEEHALVERCASAVHEHPVARRLLEVGRAEEPIVWTDPDTGVRCKGRLDFIGPTFIRDLKSSRHGDLHRIWADFGRYLYHGQAAWYHDGATCAGLIPGDTPPHAIVVQTSEPYDVVAGPFETGAVEKGRALYQTLLRRLAECQAAGIWPGIAPDSTPIRVPGWAPGGTEEGDWDE